MQAEVETLFSWNLRQLSKGDPLLFKPPVKCTSKAMQKEVKCRTAACLVDSKELNNISPKKVFYSPQASRQSVFPDLSSCERISTHSSNIYKEKAIIVQHWATRCRDR